ncbi:MAG: CBS domain-containing protein [Anaerolineales bacterium]|nr:MAG: CBS domain-containing protein [Anaerolineales bacterium]
MLVYERMSRHPLTVKPDTPVDTALKRMREEKIRRFPVVDNQGKLVGIVSDKDLLYAAPSPATSLSIYELHYLYSRITVEEVMTRKVITVEDTDPLEEAARIMVDNKVGGLPVMRDDKLVGIITETDIFKTFMEMMGARDEGLRLTLLCPDQRGELAALTSVVAELGGNIGSLGTFWGEDASSAIVTMKVSGVEKDAVVEKIKPHVLEVIDVRAV